jgi:16S rRNA (adenine1518-N6/adenine1519-N6)-dimethyltransferase
MQPNDTLDIVDNNDQTIGTAPRNETHAKNLKHRAAHILIYNTNGQLLIQLRSPNKDRHPNTWDSSAAGHLNTGENYETAARRELHEELGITPPKLKEIGYLRACQETGQEFIKIYQATHNGPFQPQTSEITALRWINPPELEQWMQKKTQDFAPALPYLWKKLKKTPPP